MKKAPNQVPFAHFGGGYEEHIFQDRISRINRRMGYLFLHILFAKTMTVMQSIITTP